MNRPAILLSLLLLVSLTPGCGLWYELTNNDAAEAEKRQKKIDADKAAVRLQFKTLVETRCEDFPAAYEKDPRWVDDDQRQLASRFAECGHWASLFRHLDDLGKDRLAELDTKHPVLDRFVEVLAQGEVLYRPPLGGFQGDGKSAEIMATWLTKRHGAAACPRIASHRAALGTSDFYFNWFYLNSGCPKESLPIARANLAHDHPDIRIQACVILGAFGDKSDSDKLSLLAMRDPYRREAETLPNGQFIAARHPVREACAAAANKLLLR